eukprot:s6166_g3.t1
MPLDAFAMRRQRHKRMRAVSPGNSMRLRQRPGVVEEDSAEKRIMERATSEHSVSTASQMEKQVSQASAASARSIISEGWRSTGMAAAALMGAGRPVEDVAPQQVRTSSSSGQLPYPSGLLEDID